MRLHPISLVVLSGILWLGIGVLLLMKGLRFVVHAPENCALLNKLMPHVGGRDQAIVLLIAIGLFAGLIKGRTVLLKAVKKTVKRILSLEAPIKLSEVYDKRYYILMLVMMSLGMLMRILHVPEDIRGTIDIAVGSALMNGAMAYFRTAYTLKTVKGS